jgi:hypothetical protein
MENKKRRSMMKKRTKICRNDKTIKLPSYLHCSKYLSLTYVISTYGMLVVMREKLQIFGKGDKDDES